MLLEENLTSQIISAAIEVHRTLGPGLLESAYQQCLCHEFDLRGIAYLQKIKLPVMYKGRRIGHGYELDLLVEDRVVLELKCATQLRPVHEAQLLTYLRLSEKRVGLLFNFHVPLLRDGIIRRVL